MALFTNTSLEGDNTGTNNTSANQANTTMLVNPNATEPMMEEYQRKKVELLDKYINLLSESEEES